MGRSGASHAGGVSRKNIVMSLDVSGSWDSQGESVGAKLSILGGGGQMRGREQA